jgi:hypothetical protein
MHGEYHIKIVYTCLEVSMSVFFLSATFTGEAEVINLIFY